MKSVSEEKEKKIIQWILYHRKLGLSVITKSIIAYAITIVPDFKEKILNLY